jgi:hypothetical protein
MNEVQKLNQNRDLIKSLCEHLRQQLKVDTPPSIKFIINKTNSEDSLGKTANYDPDTRSIQIYITGRHIKDILRSLAHEYVHHAQNCRGEFENTTTTEGYAQTDEHLRKMEKEAYLTGNIIFRDFEDGVKYGKKK